MGWEPRPLGQQQSLAGRQASIVAWKQRMDECRELRKIWRLEMPPKFSPLYSSLLRPSQAWLSYLLKGVARTKGKKDPPREQPLMGEVGAG